MQNKDKRHGWRNLFMVILALSLLGVILLGTGAVGMMVKNGKLTLDWLNFQIGSKGEYEYNHYTYTADPNIIDRIELEFDNRRVEVVKAEGDEILLEFYASQYDSYKVTEDKNTFSGKIEAHNSFFNIDFSWLVGGDANEHKTVILHLPIIYIGDLDIDTFNGDITIEGFSELGELELETSNGPVTVKDATMERLELKTSNGAVNLQDIFSDFITVKTSNGSINAVSVRAHDTLSLITSNGKIVFDDIDSNDITLKSSNGSIKGTIAQPQSDFTVTCQTSNGDCNIEEGGSGYKKLNVKTSNADIEITFSK